MTTELGPAPAGLSLLPFANGWSTMNYAQSIHPDASVFEAIRKMANEDVGSLVVIEGDKLVGMF